MNLREFLAWWLRGLEATAVTVDEALTQRRLPARDDDELARDIAELRAMQADHQPPIVPVPLTVSAAALWARPTVTPGRSDYRRPDADSVDAATRWLYGDRERGWWHAEPNEARHCALLLLAIREQVTGVRLS